MFQFGKVSKVYSSKEKDVISAEPSVLCQLEMWDDVVLTAAVHPTLGDKIKSGDFVITDVQPISQNMIRHVVIKLIRGKLGDETWKSYRKMHLARQEQQAIQLPQMPLDINPSRGMIR